MYYLYQITNNINNKIYIGITNDYKKRWSNHCCKTGTVISNAIHKYGKENFSFEILKEGLTPEEASELEILTIQSKNSRVPNGYNVAFGGMNQINGDSRDGADNNNAHLTQEEAQYILDHRDQPMYVLYDEFSEKLSYTAFKNVYKNKTYTNLTPSVAEYPYNLQFSSQFATTNKLTYNEVVELRQAYSNKIYWRDMYEKYKHLFAEWDFWNIYNGNRYKLVMPEVFTQELKNYHSSLTKRGDKNGRAKLTWDDVHKIRELHKNGLSNSELYKLYPNVSSNSIRSVINNKTWKE